MKLAERSRKEFTRDVENPAKLGKAKQFFSDEIEKKRQYQVLKYNKTNWMKTQNYCFWTADENELGKPNR